MASLNQIEANRRNSLKSTGPRTPEGKAASRFNALKTGITAKSMVIPGEDPADLQTLAAEYHAQFQPANALARFLVDNLVHADWQLRRLRRVEAQLWSHEINDSSRSLDQDPPLGPVFERAHHAFHLLQRRIDAGERSYYRALTQLQRLQSTPEIVSPAEDETSAADTEPTPRNWLRFPPSPSSHRPRACPLSRMDAPCSREPPAGDTRYTWSRLDR